MFIDSYNPKDMISEVEKTLANYGAFSSLNIKERHKLVDAYNKSVHFILEKDLGKDEIKTLNNLQKKIIIAASGSKISNFFLRIFGNSKKLDIINGKLLLLIVL